jgi:hypothetical protein
MIIWRNKCGIAVNAVFLLAAAGQIDKLYRYWTVGHSWVEAKGWDEQPFLMVTVISVIIQTVIAIVVLFFAWQQLNRFMLAKPSLVVGLIFLLSFWGSICLGFIGVS